MKLIWNHPVRDMKFGIEVIKGTRWMPRRKAPMKDVTGCEKLR